MGRKIGRMEEGKTRKREAGGSRLNWIHVINGLQDFYRRIYYGVRVGLEARPTEGEGPQGKRI